VIISRFNKLKRGTYTLLSKIPETGYEELCKFLKSDEWLDCMLTESIRYISKLLDGEIRKSGRSGTTAVSLFARRKSSGAVRVLLSNIGDSRCVVFSESDSRLIALESSASIDSVSDAIPKYPSMGSVFSFLSTSYTNSIVPLVSTRDHSLNCKSERSRVQSGNNAIVDWNLFPKEALLGESRQVYSSLELSESDVVFRLGSLLLIHESVVCRKIVRRLLEIIGYTVTETESISMACDLLKTHAAEFAAIAIAIELSPLDDREMLKRVREELKTDIPILILSSTLSSVPNSVLIDPSGAILSQPVSIGPFRDSLNNLSIYPSIHSDGIETRSISDTSSISAEFLKVMKPVLEKVYPKDSVPSIELFLNAASLACKSETEVILKSKLAVLALMYLDPSSGYICDFETGLVDLTHQYGISAVVTPHDMKFLSDDTRGRSMVRESSMFYHRKNKDGSDGPMAFFGRYNLSIAVTRSIGDRYGPRRCIALPDTIALDVQPGENIRCVLASDGLWDVVSVKKVASYLMKYKDPSEAAIALAGKASSRRQKKTIRYDDITVTVVDISPPKVTAEFLGPDVSTSCSCVLS